jgi:hypothetical protein
MVTKTFIEYTHQKLGEDYNGLAGYYTPQKEVRLAVNGREIFYIAGKAVLDSSCCGSGEWSYILVPGYVVEWKVRTNEEGLPISLVDPVADGETRSRVSRLIQEREGTDCISFW